MLDSFEGKGSPLRSLSPMNAVTGQGATQPVYVNCYNIKETALNPLALILHIWQQTLSSQVGRICFQRMIFTGDWKRGLAPPMPVCLHEAKRNMPLHTTQVIKGLGQYLFSLIPQISLTMVTGQVILAHLPLNSLMQTLPKRQQLASGV